MPFERDKLLEEHENAYATPSFMSVHEPQRKALWVGHEHRRVPYRSGTLDKSSAVVLN